MGYIRDNLGALTAHTMAAPKTLSGKNINSVRVALREAGAESALIKLSEIANINNVLHDKGDFYKLTLRESIYLDFHFHALTFAIENEFDNDQAAYTVNLANELIQTIRDDASVTMDSLMEILKKSVRGISTETTAFDNFQIKKLFQYFIDTIFKHFDLYSYTFSHEQDSRISHEEKIVDTVPLQTMLPLADAVLEETWLAEEAEKERIRIEDETNRRLAAEEQERREREDQEEAAKLKDISIEAISDKLTPEQIAIVCEKTVAQLAGPLTGEIKERLMRESKTLIRDALAAQS